MLGALTSRYAALTAAGGAGTVSMESVDAVELTPEWANPPARLAESTLPSVAIEVTATGVPL